eukprot:1160949-Pelagomonas_calceolata.AAC.1
MQISCMGKEITNSCISCVCCQLFSAWHMGVGHWTYAAHHAHPQGTLHGLTCTTANVLHGVWATYSKPRAPSRATARPYLHHSKCASWDMGHIQSAIKMRPQRTLHGLTCTTANVLHGVWATYSKPRAPSRATARPYLHHSKCASWGMGHIQCAIKMRPHGTLHSHTCTTAIVLRGTGGTRGILAQCLIALSGTRAEPWVECWARTLLFFHTKAVAGIHVKLATESSDAWPPGHHHTQQLSGSKAQGASAPFNSADNRPGQRSIDSAGQVAAHCDT